MQELENVIVKHLPPGRNLLENASSGFFSELYNLALQVHDVEHSQLKFIVLIQEQMLNGWSQTWCQELRNEILWDDLFFRLLRFRDLVELIASSPIPWIYISQHDCLNQYFEVASACSLRFWVNTTCKVGFPEINIGVFPSGGIFESSLMSTGKNINFWKANASLVIEKAKEYGLIDYLVPVFDESKIIEKLADQQNFTSFYRKPSLQKKLAIKSIADSVNFNRLLAKIRQYGKQPFNAWEFCTDLIKNRLRQFDDKELAQLLTYASAKQYLTDNYLSWVTNHLVVSEKPTFSELQKETPTVNISLEHFAPPVGPFSNLLRLGVGVIFCAEDPHQLRSFLEIMYGRLENQIGIKECQSLWEKYVNWNVLSNLEKTNSPTFIWTLDDKQIIKYQKQTIEVLRLQGNYGDAPPGICEYVLQADEQISSLLLDLLGSTAGTVIKTTGMGSIKVPLAIVVRSMFLEELIKMTINLGIPLTNLLGVLRSFQWIDAATEQFWERFLMVRQSYLAVDMNELNLNSFVLKSAIWNFSLWKEAKNYVKTSSQYNPDMPYQEDRINEHFLLYTAFIAKLISQQSILLNPKETDRLVISALGVPHYLGAPLDYLERNKGRGGWYYGCKTWPDIVASLR